MSRPDDRTDVLVLGAGLAGLTAAVRCAQLGHTVRLLERLPRAGGLCGEYQLDGHTFVRACNEFGSEMATLLAELGADVQFRPSRSRFHLAHGTVQLPPDLSTALGLLPRLPGMWRLWRASKRPEMHSLADLVDAAGDPVLTDLVGIVASLAGVPLGYMRLDEMGQVMRDHDGYGWKRPVKPLGGPQALTDALVQRLRDLGGTLQCNVAVQRIERHEGGFVAHTHDGTFRARQVITSQPRWDAYPADAPPSLALAQVLLVVDEGLRFPGDVETLYSMPARVRETMDQLAAGKEVHEFGFSLIRNHMPVQDGTRTLVGFFAAPAGVHDFDPAQRDRLGTYIRTRGEAMLPGLNAALKWMRLVSPADFERLHGLSSTPLQRMTTFGTPRPQILDPRTGLHHVGVSVQPPGNDGNAAARSGKMAADLVHAALQETAVP